MSDTLLDLFDCMTPAGGREAFSGVVLAPHCLGKDRLGQLLSVHQIVSLRPPFMTTVTTDCAQQDDAHHKQTNFAFESPLFLQTSALVDRTPLLRASDAVLAEWQSGRSGRGGICVGVSGCVACVTECPAFKECVRDNRQLQFTVEALGSVELALGRVLAKNTLDHLLQKLLALHGPRIQGHARRLAESKDHSRRLQLHLLFMEDHFVLVRCAWKSQNAAPGSLGTKYFTGTAMNVASMQRTYFNALHVATIVRQPDFERPAEFQWEMKRGDEFQPVSVDQVVEAVREHCSCSFADPEGVD